MIVHLKKEENKMLNFENKSFKGPLKDYLEECKKYRIESIYNRKYRYIKKIIFDTELENKFGNTRMGYEKYKNDYSIIGNVAFGGYNDLREITDDKNNIIGYILETKLSKNEHFNKIIKIVKKAKEKTIEILKVTDVKSFNYYLNEIGFNIYNDTNSLIDKIKKLENIIEDYQTDKDFKLYLDKIIK